ncbi:hypothetical protein L798_05546 [Zootermopsis nevadensis]|uniref:Uncharacterized protein n=1 Tax=Zootermopsis nevadensis TaxID=136037 RepID=A0A067R9I5_ZOONE|nr:hypothetical protein L798_05546 [Zootermopsis nevadensis]
MSSMPVDDNALTAKVICDLHHYSVSQAYLYLGTWNLMIHCRHYANTSATSYTTGGPASCCITQQTLYCCA